MTSPLYIKVYHNQRLVFSTPFEAAVELGRQRTGEPEPYCKQGNRLIVAPLSDKSVHRRAAHITPTEDGRLLVSNLSSASRIEVRREAMDGESLTQASDYEALDPRATTVVDIPAVLVFAERVIRLERAAPEVLRLESLSEPTRPPSLTPTNLGTWAPDASMLQAVRTADPAELMCWLRGITGVMQSAANHPDFLAQATQLVAELSGLNRVATLLHDGQRWSVECERHAADSAVDSGQPPSQTMLDRVKHEKRTFRHLPSVNPQPESILDVTSLVAAPILDQTGEVIGAIYGDRRGESEPADEITALEASLVELIACAVAAGLARVEQEQRAAKLRIQFEQFFSPALSRQLEKDPRLLEGKDVDVSVLFCDIRGSSRINERLGPVRTMNWISDVMGAFSECVIQQDGVLVDYRGDEIVAMWGAPVPQHDHAARACAAALGILDELPAVNSRWQEELGEAVRIGIGINSGTARAGNIGSHRKFQYGVLGKTIDLASRVQGATKHTKADLLVTGETAVLVADTLSLRRLCRVRMVNLEKPVELYELRQPSDEWMSLKTVYEAALAAYEGQDFREAARVLGNAMADFPDDGPTTVLLLRVVNAMVEGTDEFDPCWILTTK